MKMIAARLIRDHRLEPMTTFSRSHLSTVSLSQYIPESLKALALLFLMGLMMIPRADLLKRKWCKKPSLSRLKRGGHSKNMSNLPISNSNKTLSERMWKKCYWKETPEELGSTISPLRLEKRSLSRQKIKWRKGGQNRVRKLYLSISFHSLKSSTSLSLFHQRSITMKISSVRI